MFRKVSRVLKVDGYLFACFKYGDFEGERSGRYFTDLTENELESIIADIEEFQIIETSITGDVRAGSENEKWPNAIIKRIF